MLALNPRCRPTWTVGAVLLVLLAGLALAPVACSPDRPAGPVPDTVPPVVRVLSPTYYAYDEDGDGLVDLRLEWSDSGGAVNAAAVRVRALTGVSALGGDTINLLDHWRLERRDATGLVAHETIGFLLHGGVSRLEVTVPDTGGASAIDTITFVLPHAALLKTIVTGLTGFPPAVGLTLCPDDGRLYMPGGNFLVVVDPDSLRLVAVVPPSLLVGRYSGQLWNPLCVAGDPVLYITSQSGLMRFDRNSSQWLQKIGYYGSVGIAQSRADPDLLYLGWGGGVIGLVSRSSDSSSGYLLPVRPSSDVMIWDIAVLRGDAKLYAAYYHTGIWVVDPRRDSVLDSISVGGSWFGTVQKMALTQDDRWLYAAVGYGSPRGVHELDTGTDRVTRTVSLDPFRAVKLALSPDERRIFVTTQDNVPTSPSSNALIDVPSWRVIQTLPRPRPTGEWRWDQAAVFHPNGRYIFVAHNRDIDVYLHRP